jgi:hypothetical protein
MPTYYVEDYDGKKSDDAVEPVVLAPVFEHLGDTKRLEASSVEDKAVKSSKKSANK